MALKQNHDNVFLRPFCVHDTTIITLLVIITNLELGVGQAAMKNLTGNMVAISEENF